MFNKKQAVRHKKRPEWGEGFIEQVQNVPVNGQEGQRLVIRFKNAGRKTVHTAYAPIVPVEAWEATAGKARPRLNADEVTADTLGEAVARQSGTHNEQALALLPESLSDPFRSLEARLKDTIGLYRFEKTPRGMIDWACFQTGLEDPLQVWPRNMLETGFMEFRRHLDAHLAVLIRDIKKDQGQVNLAALKEIKIPADAQQALARLR